MPVARHESSATDVTPLAQPLKFEFSGRVAKNRLIKAAMEEDLATWHPTNLEERGVPTRESIELYRRWGEGGWGIILTGNLDIEFDMLDSIGDAIITPECAPTGSRFEAFRSLASAAKAHGSLILAQVTHPGRQLFAKIRKDTISASALPLGPLYAEPREATKGDIERVVEGFAHAASFLEKAGFDGVELHGAHGFLISQFLSAQSNRRTDEYGGNVANRMRLVVEIAHAIRGRTSREFILGIKLNSVEFQEHGMTPDETREICETLQREGLDFVELSGGNHADIGFGGEHEKMKDSSIRREAYFLEFVRDIVPHLSATKKFLVGGFRTAASMAKAVSEEGLDGIALGRPAAQEPRLANDLLSGRVTGTIKPLLEFVLGVWLGVGAAIAQMHQIALGREPFDSSDASSAQIFKEAYEAKGKAMAEDGDKCESRMAVSLESTQANVKAYGDAY